MEPPRSVDLALAELSDLDLLATQLQNLTDGQLHLADPEGGWTVAQIVSHIQLSGQLWVAVLARVAATSDDPLFVYREELGHDAVGAPPPTVADAVGRIASVRRAVADALAAAPPPLWDRAIEVPPFGAAPLAGFVQPIVGHLTGHASQARAVLEARGVVLSTS